MFPGSVRPETSASHSQYDHRLHPSSDQYPGYQSWDRNHYEPPRPLEPRPTLHASLSDTASMQRRQEPFRTMSGLSDQRRSGPSLPGLRDIFTPGPTTTPTTPYASSWHTTAPPAAPTPTERPRFTPSYVHPPMVLEPNAHPPPEPRPRSWEVPVHANGPETTHQSQHMPLSSYQSYRPDYSRYAEARYELVTPNSAVPQTPGVPSPYNGMATDGSPWGGMMADYEQNQHPNRPTVSTENQKKYIGVKDVPGEGTFHCYEGGHRIPTHVDGEHVNPAWGLTKANKPRKRLALACLDCREKKIKCEPGAISCLQCEKAKRPCRRNPAQQSQAESVSSQDWSPGALHSRSKASISDPTPVPSRDIEPDTQSKRRSREDPSPPSVPHKKHRSASPLRAVMHNASLPVRDGRTADSADKAVAAAPREGVMSWEVDPYAVDPDVTLQLLDVYFTNFNNATYCLYPRQHFSHWLKAYPDKCQNERMVLYAMLAVASSLADDSMSGVGRQCARVAMEILPLQAGTINMCTAQARILLALYSFGRGEYTAAWEHSGAAIRAVTHLQYHTEQGCLDGSGADAQARNEFNLSVAQYAECRRRTCWSVFLMDRYCQPAVTMLKPQDIFVRLPCTEEMYEEGLMSDAPYLNNGIIDPVKSLLTPGSSLAPMAWHALVAAIWGDVVDFIFRAPYQADASYRDKYESFYAETCNRLQGWLSRLPQHLQYSEANLDRSIQHQYVGTFISIHAVYHLCFVKLNRCLRHALARDLVKRNIRAAHRHGHHMLQMMCAVRAARRDIDPPSPGEQQARTFAISVPFPGYAILAAVDVVSAGGSDDALGQTLDEMRGGLDYLQALARCWHSARDQARLCERRYYQIQNILTNPGRARSGAWLGRKWGLEKPLESLLPAEDDCIYGLVGGSNENIYFDAFGEEAEDRHYHHHHHHHHHSRTGAHPPALRIA